MIRRLLPCLLMLLPTTARAEWLEASSDHFVVFADDSEADIRRFSDQLERYHAAMAFVSQLKVEKPSPSNRVTVFVVRDARTVRSIYGAANSAVQGFYIPRAGASLAVVPRIDSGRRETDFSMIVLLHEYAHHFLLSGSGLALPRWVNEGSAEFFAAAAFDAKGGVSLGRAANHRGAELYMARDVPARLLVDPEAYDRRKNDGYDAFYGKSWLLYHYLTFTPQRRGQMARYLRAIAAGKTSLAAAQEAFGDLAQLERDLDAYLRKPRINMLDIPADRLAVGQVAVRRISPGEAAIMPIRIRSRRGVTEQQANELVAEARTIAARYPADPAVLAALAEAEFDAGDDGAAIKAADAALKLDPAQVNAYVQKGYALFRTAAKASNEAAAYARARAPFIALNSRENDHPLPLIYFYRSFVEQGAKPPEIAVQGLERALELAPFDEGLRTTVALQHLRDGRREIAQGHLKLLASNPHGGGPAAFAKSVLAKMDSDPHWDGRDGIETLVSATEATPDAPSKLRALTGR